jgi:hypothetical protein
MVNVMKFRNRQWDRFVVVASLGLSAGLGLGWTLGWSQRAIAAEQVILKYHFYEATVDVDDLVQLAETGEVSRSLRAHFNLAGQDPERARALLTREISFNPRTLDRVLYSPIGNLVLDEIGESIHTPSQSADRQAIRAAINLSIQDDGRLTLLEIIQNYPTQEVHVDGNNLRRTYNQLQSLQSGVETILGPIQEIWEIGF